MRATVLAWVLVVLVVSVPGNAWADAVLTGRVTDLLGKPVAGARVHVLAGGERQTVTTDRDGTYRVVVESGRDVSVVIGAGDQHTFRRGAIKDGTIQHLDIEVELAEGEVIRIIDQKPPAVPPRLPANAPRVTPPYSDEAVARDAWAKAWLLLDIDETGKVLRVKLVKRPGFGLDEIAVQEAMKLRFEPALDEQGKPMRTRLMWAMEWPSRGWLVEHNGTATRMPVEFHVLNPLLRGFGGFSTLVAPPQEAASLRSVTCAGSGPLNLDYRYPVYRDCSRPNLKKLPHLPWLDGTQPIPPDPPSIARKPEPPLRLTRASYIPQLAMTGATAALLAGTIYSYGRFIEFADRVAAATSPTRPVLDRDQYIHDYAGRNRWQRLAMLGTVATIASGAISGLLWFRHQRRSEFSVQPEDDGASVSFSGRF